MLPPGLHREAARVARVVDGDSLRLADGRAIRLIGVNTPELHSPDGGHRARPFAERARRAVEAWLGARDITLVFDKERRDQHGRTLAHVFSRDGESLEAMLLGEGLAWHVAIPPNLTLARCLAGVEEQARRRGLGVWSQPPVRARFVTDGGYQRVRGKVVKVSFANAWWLSLEGQVAAVIYPEHQHRFARETVKSLRGQVIEIGGWVYPASGSKYEPWRLKLETPFGYELSE